MRLINVMNTTEHLSGGLIAGTEVGRPNSADGDESGHRRQDVIDLEAAKEALQKRRGAQGRRERHDEERGIETCVNDPGREADLREQELHHSSRVQADSKGD